MLFSGLIIPVLIAIWRVQSMCHSLLVKSFSGHWIFITDIYNISVNVIVYEPVLSTMRYHPQHLQDCHWSSTPLPKNTNNTQWLYIQDNIVDAFIFGGIKSSGLVENKMVSILLLTWPWWSIFFVGFVLLNLCFLTV